MPGISGQIPIDSLYWGKFILPVNRGSGKSGPGKSGSDCILFIEEVLLKMLECSSEKNDSYLSITFIQKGPMIFFLTGAPWFP